VSSVHAISHVLCLQGASAPHHRRARCTCPWAPPLRSCCSWRPSTFSHHRGLCTWLSCPGPPCRSPPRRSVRRPRARSTMWPCPAPTCRIPQTRTACRRRGPCTGVRCPAPTSRSRGPRTGCLATRRDSSRGRVGSWRVARDAACSTGRRGGSNAGSTCSSVLRTSAMGLALARCALRRLLATLLHQGLAVSDG